MSWEFRQHVPSDSCVIPLGQRHWLLFGPPSTARAAQQMPVEVTRREGQTSHMPLAGSNVEYGGHWLQRPSGHACGVVGGHRQMPADMIFGARQHMPADVTSAGAQQVPSASRVSPVGQGSTGVGCATKTQLLPDGACPAGQHTPEGVAWPTGQQLPSGIGPWPVRQHTPIGLSWFGGQQTPSTAGWVFGGQHEPLGPTRA